MVYIWYKICFYFTLIQQCLVVHYDSFIQVYFSLLIYEAKTCCVHSFIYSFIICFDVTKLEINKTNT